LQACSARRQTFALLAGDDVHVRANQVGYHSADSKVAIAFSHAPVGGTFSLLEVPSDYGWGSNSYRVIYGADGKPQGLRRFKSESTGLANLAGRCAVAMAMANQIWKQDLDDTTFADRCLQEARKLYAMGTEKEGVQQGNS